MPAYSDSGVDAQLEVPLFYKETSSNETFEIRAGAKHTHFEWSLGAARATLDVPLVASPTARGLGVSNVPIVGADELDVERENAANAPIIACVARNADTDFERRDVYCGDGLRISLIRRGNSISIVLA